MTLNSCGLVLYHLRLASVLELSRVGDVTSRSLRALLELLLGLCLPQNNLTKEEWDGGPAMPGGISAAADPGIFLLESWGGGGGSLVP